MAQRRRNTIRIEVCGGIASGKTTLTRLLASTRIAPLYENFESNPFYNAFYRDPASNAFETELTFLLQHYHQQKEVARRRQVYCCDFSLLLDMAYADVTLADGHRKLFQKVHRETEALLPRRNLLVYLRCTPEIELSRIRRRKRYVERAITIGYLSRLENALRARLRSYRDPMLVIDSSRHDFATNRTAQRSTLESVQHALSASRMSPER